MSTSLKILKISRTLLKITIVFVVPVLLLKYAILPRSFYLIILQIASCVVLFFIIQEHWTLRALQIRTDTFLKSISSYCIFTLLGILVLLVLATLLGKEQTSQNLFLLFFAWSIPIGIVQEFLYRGFLMKELSTITSSLTLRIILNASIFAFMHILYDPIALLLPLTFFAGVAFAWMYVHYKNLLLVGLSHGVLNFFAIWYGFF